MRRYGQEHFSFSNDLLGPAASVSKSAEADVDLAARLDTPVLISAAPEQALGIALLIASRRRGLRPPAVLVCDPSDGDDAVEALADARRSSEGRGVGPVLLLREVQLLAPGQQQAVFERLVDLHANGSRPGARLIASTSVDLHELVQRGAFDERLFYRLNAIHIAL